MMPLSGSSSSRFRAVLILKAASFYAVSSRKKNKNQKCLFVIWMWSWVPRINPLPLLLVRGLGPGFPWSSLTQLWFFTVETQMKVKLNSKEQKLSSLWQSAVSFSRECHWWERDLLDFQKIGSTISIQWINCFHLEFIQPEYGYGIQ